MTRIVPVNSRRDIRLVADLANIIWTEHYTLIIGVKQVTYMLDKFQSAEAIQEQVHNGNKYYLMVNEGEYVGYFSFIIIEDFLFLSKFYVLKSVRGKGIGKAALQFIEDRVRELGLKKIKLTVNKYNSNSIKAYEKMGFENVDAIVQDIGNGYVMDDYVLEKNIK